jgi:CHAT domain-containing protein
MIGVSLPSTCKLVSLELCEQTGGLPWELLPAGGRPVGLVGPVQRQLRQHNARPIQMGQIRRVLLIAGENTEPKLPCLEMEIKAIERFERHHNVFVDRWRPDANRVADLIDKVAHADIVHVCGHVHEAMTEDGRFEHRLQLDGHQGSELSLASLVPDGRPRPRLVWLNTCHAGMPIAGGAAASLLEAGCTSLIGSLLPIADETAAKFVHLFYQRLIAGGDVAWCVYELRRSLAAMAHPGWSSIVSYGKGDRLF